MRKKTRHLRKGRFILAIFAVVMLIFPADFIRRSVFRYMDLYSSGHAVVKVQGRADKKNIAKINVNEPENSSDEKYNSMFSETAIDESQLFSGSLVKVDSDTPYISTEMTQTVDLIYYRNDYYTLINETDSVILNADAAEALNLMMADYYDSTGHTNFLVYGTTNTYTGEGSYCPKAFPESVTGNTIDLAVNVGSTVLTYDGCDDEKWIVDNCYKYGYIVRFPSGKSQITSNAFCPWHLRYVGKVHSAVMNELNCCLEEYLELLKKYTYDHPLTYNLNGTMYIIYSVQSTGQTTTAQVPAMSEYSISGNNTDGFIITSLKF
ncbi:MAG: D-alanyl-D-alanine carboxypeptidase family protein [Ruminococcus sp.]|nr:D-alanyl-D-alanine carboxypeptidase family protein [Ruminococcus sp.]